MSEISGLVNPDASNTKLKSCVTAPCSAKVYNKFEGNPVRYVENINVTYKAILLSKDILEIESFLTTGGGVTNPSTTAVSFDFSAYSLPACFTNGTKKYLFSTYGNRANSQASTDFYF